MEELSDFFDKNLDDPKAQFLEKLRLKLKRALQYRKTYDPSEDGPMVNSRYDFTQNKAYNSQTRGMESSLSSSMQEDDEDSEDDIERESLRVKKGVNQGRKPEPLNGRGMPQHF